MPDRPAFLKTLALCAVFLLFTSLLSLTLGSADISLKELFLALAGRGSPAVSRILIDVRLPRTAAAILAGSALAASGVVIQSVLYNPLAGPNIIGVNSGAGLCAVICAAFFPSAAWLMPAASFLGALAAMLLIYAIARLTGASRITLVLAGIAVGSILYACIDAVVTVYPEALLSVNAFRVGSIAGSVMKKLWIPGAFIVFAVVFLLTLSRDMDVLALGEETAASLGMNTKKYRFLLLLCAAMLSGAAVSFSGLLGFVGLIVPHAARFIAGSESRRLLPVSVLMGGAFVTLCDVLARVLFAPYEIPVGIVMSFIGGPFFIWLLIRRKGGRTDNA